MNCELLTEIQDNFYDTFIANLVLHITNDPVMMIRNANRVLK